MKPFILFCCLFCSLHSSSNNISFRTFQSPTTVGSLGDNAEKYTSNERWVTFFNNKIESLDSLYLPGAILVTANGETLKTMQERKGFYLTLEKSIGKIKSITTTYITDITPELSYEIGSFVTESNKKMKHLIIWRKVKNVFFREVELISEVKDETTDFFGIDTARNKWMGWCNSHKVSELVSNSYFENAVYYNNYRVIAGTAAITKEYGYMNNSNYRLTLTPIIKEAVTESLVFEIGQCSGSYKDKYILVWGKRNGSHWKVVFDSNL